MAPTWAVPGLLRFVSTFCHSNKIHGLFDASDVDLAPTILSASENMHLQKTFEHLKIFESL